MRNPTTAWGGVEGEARMVCAWVKAASSSDGEEEEEEGEEDRRSREAFTSRKVAAVVVVVIMVEVEAACRGRGVVCALVGWHDWTR